MLHTFTLRLIFYGLVALVPNAADKPTAISFLMVDAPGRQYASDGCELPAHFPSLFVRSGNCSYDAELCSSSSRLPAPEGIRYSWALDGQQVTIGLPGSGSLSLAGGRAVGTELPKTVDEARDASWIPPIEATVATDCLEGAFHCPLAGRINVNRGVVSVCHLEASDEALGGNVRRVVHSFELRPLGGGVSNNVAKRQAVADAIVVTIEGLDRDSPVELMLKDLHNSAEHKIILSAKAEDANDPDANFVDVWFVNIPKPGEHSDSADVCNNPKIDRHFQLYYGFVERKAQVAPISLAERLIPQATAEITEIQATGCPLLTFHRTRSGSGPIPHDKPACGIPKFTANALAAKSPSALDFRAFREKEFEQFKLMLEKDNQ